MDHHRYLESVLGRQELFGWVILSVSERRLNRTVWADLVPPLVDLVTVLPDALAKGFPEASVAVNDPKVLIVHREVAGHFLPVPVVLGIEFALRFDDSQLHLLHAVTPFLSRAGQVSSRQFAFSSRCSMMW